MGVDRDALGLEYLRAVGDRVGRLEVGGGARRLADLRHEKDGIRLGIGPCQGGQ